MPVVDPRRLDSYTGAAYIFVEESTGNNAIIVGPGAATTDLAGRHGWPMPA